MARLELNGEKKPWELRPCLVLSKETQNKCTRAWNKNWTALEEKKEGDTNWETSVKSYLISFVHFQASQATRDSRKWGLLARDNEQLCCRIRIKLNILAQCEFQYKWNESNLE